MCLNGECALFWTLNEVLAPEAQNYNLERWARDGFLSPCAMNPELIQPNATHGQAFPATRQCLEAIAVDATYDDIKMLEDAALKVARLSTSFRWT